jgi:hypothetical protein
VTGLDGLVARRRPPGIYRWQGAFGVDEVRHRVESAGDRFAHLDGAKVETKAEFLTVITLTPCSIAYVMLAATPKILKLRAAQYCYGIGGVFLREQMRKLFRSR